MNKLCVQVLDIDTLPIPSAQVVVSPGYSSPQISEVTNSQGITAEIPWPSDQFGMVVSHPKYRYTEFGGFHLFQGDIGFDRDRVLSVIRRQDGSDLIFQVTVVLGKSRNPQGPTFLDASVPVNNAYLKPWQTPWRDFDCPRHPLAGTGSTGWDRFNASHDTLPTPQGECLFVEHVDVGQPKLFAVWIPSNVNLAESTPINYFVYFTPVNFRNSGPYPQDESYAEMGRRYLGWQKRSLFYIAKAGVRAITVVPIVDMASKSFYESLTQTDLYRMLREIDFYLTTHRHANLSRTWLRRGLGKVALCGFSNGPIALASVMMQQGSDVTRAREFAETKLKEVYCLDGAPEDANRFMRALKQWYSKGAGDKRFRIYTKESGYETIFSMQKGDFTNEAVSPTTKQLSSIETLKEWHGTSPHFTLALVSGPYIQPVLDLLIQKIPDNLDLHHFFPIYFLGHALEQSSLK